MSSENTIETEERPAICRKTIQFDWELHDEIKAITDNPANEIDFSKFVRTACREYLDQNR